MATVTLFPIFQSKKHGKRRGFTLLELLIVVFILILLIGIGVSAISKGLHTSKVSKSLTNMRQLAMALNLYADDNNDRYPYIQDGDGTYWNRNLEDFLDIKSDEEVKDLFVCPVADDPIDFDLWGVPTLYSAHRRLLGYASRANVPGIPRSRIKKPSSLILLATGPQTHRNGGTTSFFSKPYQGPYRNAKNPMQAIPLNDVHAGFDYRFDDKVGVVMVDGHAETIERGKVVWGNIVPE